MVNNKLRTALLCVLVCGLVLSAGSVGKKGGAAREKARYYYRQALIEQVDSNAASAYELYKRAYEIDPTYSEAASAVASNRLTLPLDTMRSEVEMKRSLAMMKQYVDEYPDDINESVYYAYVCTRVDSLDEAERVYKHIYSRFPKYTGLLHNLSELSMVRGDVSGAVDYLNQYERAEGSNPQLTLRKISYLLHGRDTIGAIEEANRYVNLKQREPVSYILRGNLYEIIGRTDSVESNYLQAEQVAPGSGAAKIALAEFYTEQGDSVKGDSKTYEALMAEDLELSDKVEILERFLGKLFAGKNDTERGDKLFSVLAQQYPHQEELMELSARYAFAKGDLLKAIEEINYALGLSPSNPLYYNQKMTYLMGLGLPEEIEKTYKEAKTHLSPSDVEGLRILYAVGVCSDDNYERAIVSLNKLLQEYSPELKESDKPIDPSIIKGFSQPQRYVLAQTYSMIGDMRNQSKDKKGWREAYDRSLELMPDLAMTLNNYAYFEANEDGDITDAEEKSRRTIEMEPDNATFLDTYAWIKYLQGEYEEALKYLEAAIEKSRGDDGNISSEYYEHLEKIKRALGDNEGADEAAEMFQKVKKDEEKAETEAKERQESLQKEYKQKIMR